MNAYAEEIDDDTQKGRRKDPVHIGEIADSDVEQVEEDDRYEQKQALVCMKPAEILPVAVDQGQEEDDIGQGPDDFLALSQILIFHKLFLP